MPKVTIDATGLSFKELNDRIRRKIRSGYKEIEILNANGQRYIGDGIRGDVRIIIHGVAGNDLGAFMDGSTIIAYENVGDGVGNTMNRGRIIVHGSAGDVVGYSIRGGEIFIRGNVGYRAGIHMKEYLQNVPTIVVGGLARDFLGEYMAGGRLIVLGMNVKDEIVGDNIATGMHGGKIFIRGEVDESKLGVGAEFGSVNAQDKMELKRILSEYCKVFRIPMAPLIKSRFTKIVPTSYRPYEKTYAIYSAVG